MGISDLPDDVLIHILVRLPLESLGQFKCLSRSWNSLISSHKFIDSKLNQSRIVQKPNVLISEYDEIRMAEFSITGEEMVEREDFDCNVKRIHCLPELLDDRIIIQIVGSVNGLLCLLLSPKHETIYPFYEHDKCGVINDCVFALCNPLTKSTRDLPGNEWKKFFSDESLYGFWYDDVNDDYKVVIMNLAFEKVGVHVYEGEVYSLRSNSWSKVHSYLDLSIDYIFSKDFAYGVRINCAGVLLNCALHWILYDGLGPVSILVFDLRTYKSDFLPMPKAEYLGEIDHLTVLNGCLVLSNGCQYEELYDLWVMKDYGLSDSWMKITINKPFANNEFAPLALIEDDHKRILISRIGSDHMLGLNDLVSHESWYIQTPCNFFPGAKQVQFVGSLVQPYPPSEDMSENILGSLDAVAGDESLIKEQILNALKNFDKFRIHVHGVSVDSQLPEHVRRRYYDLCCSKKSFLHERLVPNIPSKLAVSMIIDVVNIADSIRSCRFTTSKEEIEKWENSLRSFEPFGFNVGFLRERIRQILCLAFDSEGGIEAKRYWEVKTKRSQMEDEIKDLEKRLVEMKEACKKYGDEVNTLKPKAVSYKLMVQEEANAPW